jgi:hypothetical protein
MIEERAVDRRHGEEEARPLGALEILQWPFDDPARVEGSEELQLAAFRRTRDEIDARLREWLRSN